MAKEQSLANLLAKELGYKDAKDLKKRLDGGSSTNVSENIKGRLRSGEGFLSSFKGGISDTGEAVAKKMNPANFGKSVYKNLIGGDDIFSAYLQGRGKNKKGGVSSDSEDISPTPEGKGGGLSEDGVAYLRILAKNSMSFHYMSRDINVMRQNLQKLVKIKAGPQKKGEKAYAEGADRFFLKEDEKETALEVQRQKIAGPSPTPAAAGGEGKGEGGGGIIDTVMQMFSGGFMKAVKFIFNPKMLGKVFSKVFVPLTIIATLFSGITAGFKRYQETGSLTDAISAGLGGMLEFVTFGLFGEDTLKSLWDSISGFFDPITQSISSIFTGIKDFVKGLFPGLGGDEEVKAAEPIKPTQPNAKEFTAESKGGEGAKGTDSGEKKSDKTKTKSDESSTSPTPKTGADTQQTVAPASAVSTETPTTGDAPLKPTPVPSASMSSSDQISQIQGYIDGNNRALTSREKNVKARIDAFKKNHADEPDKIQEFTKKENESLEKYRKQVEEANEEHKSNIAELKKSSPSTSSAPTAPAAGATSSSPSESGSSGGGSAAAVSGGGSPPSAEGGSKSPSGSDINNASTAVAEGQRMESSADAGSVVNSPKTTNNTNASGKEPTQIGDVYDSEFANLLSMA